MIRDMGKYFGWSFFVLLCGMALAFWRGESVGAGFGLGFLTTAVIISILEVSLSFDNAVINATKLEHMSHEWRRRFLTWGILIAVFGMRFVFPVVIVSAFSGVGCWDVLMLALHRPDEYARHLHEANVGISAFGGTFLMMLFCEFMFDRNKNCHWLGVLERFLRRVGRSRLSPTVATIFALGIAMLFLDTEHRGVAAAAGVGGIIIHLIIHGASEKLSKLAANQNAFALKHAGLMAFLYLEVIDASFSLDGVLGAFALTKDVVIIAIGLAVGAFFVRSLTVILVEKKTLSNFKYLTNGAYWAIGSLAAIMLISTIEEVPEFVTGTIGMIFILSSMFSSITHNRRVRKISV